MSDITLHLLIPEPQWQVCFPRINTSYRFLCLTRFSLSGRKTMFYQNARPIKWQTNVHCAHQGHRAFCFSRTSTRLSFRLCRLRRCSALPFGVFIGHFLCVHFDSISIFLLGRLNVNNPDRKKLNKCLIHAERPSS